MNIFVVSADHQQCAQALDDRRLIKMILETAQMLSTALAEVETGNVALYKPTHLNHPCTRWVMSSDIHRNWTIGLFFAYCNEYGIRYGREHASHVHLHILALEMVMQWYLVQVYLKKI